MRGLESRKGCPRARKSALADSKSDGFCGAFLGHRLPSELYHEQSKRLRRMGEVVLE